MYVVKRAVPPLHLTLSSKEFFVVATAIPMRFASVANAVYYIDSKRLEWGDSVIRNCYIQGPRGGRYRPLTGSKI